MGKTHHQHANVLADDLLVLLFGQCKLYRLPYQLVSYHWGNFTILKEHWNTLTLKTSDAPTREKEGHHSCC